MSHIDEGTLLALRDGESVDGVATRHADVCESCRAALREARERAEAIHRLLSDAGDTPAMAGAPDVLAAKARVRARLDAAPVRLDAASVRPDAASVRPERRRGRLGHLRRAAAILAVTAGAVYAVPRSPLANWLGLGLSERGDEVAPATAVPAGPGDAGQEALLIPVGDGIDIVLTGVAAGTVVELDWLAGTAARVTAGPGAEYSVAQGRASVAVAGGPVQIGVPRSAPMISISINGRTVFSGTSDDGIASDVAARDDDHIVFVVPRP